MMRQSLSRYGRLGLHVFLACLVLARASSAVIAAQGRPLRPSPPQPQQQQGLDYFAGSWSFAWTGRESALTAGPRSGNVAFTKNAAGDRLEMKADGTIEGGGTFQEAGSLTWDASGKMLTLRERLAGVEVQGPGNWSSPIAIHFLSAPVRVKNQSLQLRRTYSIISGVSFIVTEEMSTDGGPFVRLGTGDFKKKP